MIHQGQNTMGHMGGMDMGHPGHEEMEAVDMAPHEVDHLNHIQGGAEVTPHGYHMFRSLGARLNHPDVHNYLHQVSQGRRMAAMGGSMMEGTQGMPHEGMSGAGATTVYMPKHMVGLLSHMTGVHDPHPMTGRRHYFLGSLVGHLKNAAGAIGRNMGSMFSGTGNTLRNMIPNASQFGDYAKRGLSSLSRHATDFAGNMAGLPQDQRNMQGLMGAAGRGIGQAAQAGVQHAQNAVSSPDFKLNGQGIRDVARGSFGAARDNAMNQMHGALSSPYAEEEMGGNPYEGHSFASQFGNMGHQAGADYGGHYGDMAGSGAGNLLNRGISGAANRFGANPEQAGMTGGAAANKANIYGRNTGRHVGSAIAGRAGHLLGSALDRAGNHFNNRFAAPQGAMHPELEHGYSDDLFQ